MSIRDVHEQMLRRFRDAMNLIGPGPTGFHFRDCAEGLESYTLKGHWVDLGSGAGFPGLVMAELFPTLELTLVESRQKRATFLRHVVMTAELQSRVHVAHTRVEELPDRTFDGVVSRAFAPVRDVVVHARRLLKGSGSSVVLFAQDLEGAVHQLPADMQRISGREYRVDGKARCTLWLEWKEGTST